MPTKQQKTTQLVFRVEPDIVQLIDDVAELAARSVSSGSRAAVLRTALRRGLEQMKAELGAASKPKRR